jgi:hypothetical protein
LLKAGVFSIGGSQALVDALITKLEGGTSESSSSPALPPHFTGIVAKEIPIADLEAAEKLGIDLATKMMAEGAKEILEATKAKMATEIRAEQTRRQEANKTRANDPV